MEPGQRWPLLDTLRQHACWSESLTSRADYLSYAQAMGLCAAQLKGGSFVSHTLVCCIYNSAQYPGNMSVTGTI